MTTKYPKLSIEMHDPALLRTIKHIAVERDVSLREIVTEALREWVERQENEEDLRLITEVEDEETVPWEQAKAEIRQQWAERGDA